MPSPRWLAAAACASGGGVAATPPRCATSGSGTTASGPTKPEARLTGSAVRARRPRDASRHGGAEVALVTHSDGPASAPRHARGTSAAASRLRQHTAVLGGAPRAAGAASGHRMCPARYACITACALTGRSSNNASRRGGVVLAATSSQRHIDASRAVVYHQGACAPASAQQYNSEVASRVAAQKPHPRKQHHHRPHHCCSSGWRYSRLRLEVRLRLYAASSSTGCRYVSNTTKNLRLVCATDSQ